MRTLSRPRHSADPESNALWDLGLVVVTLAAVGYGGKRLFDYVTKPQAPPARE